MTKEITRYNKLTKFVKQEFKENLVEGSMYLEFKIMKISECLHNKRKSLVLFALYHLNLTSSWEIANYINKFYPECRKLLSELVFNGLVQYVPKNNSHSKLLYRFWKQVYPTASTDTSLYQINPRFLLVYELYLDYFRHEYRELAVDLKRRQTRFEKFMQRAEQIENNKKKRIEAALGTCINCGMILDPEREKGKDYKVFPKGLVCKSCFDEYGIAKAGEWIQEN